MFRPTLAVAALMLVGCATAPKTYNIDSTYPFDHPQADVWQAVVYVAGENNWPIRLMETESGYLGLEQVRTTDELDCGNPDITSTQSAAYADINITVQGDQSTSLMRVNVRGSAVRTSEFGDGSQHVVECNSTGMLESTIATMVRDRLATKER